MTRVYEEFIDFVALGTATGGGVAFRPSDEARTRVAQLVAKEKAGDLSPEATSRRRGRVAAWAGEVTVRWLLDRHHPDRLAEREIWSDAGTYPSPHA